jgi:hypothetical protein
VTARFDGSVVLVTAGLGIGQSDCSTLLPRWRTGVVTDSHERRTREVAKAMAEDFPDCEIINVWSHLHA